MKYYFTIQAKRIARWFEQAGVLPFIGWLICLLMFVASSFFLFYKLAFAEWVYFFIAILVLIELGKSERIQLLKSIFQDKKLRSLRLIENLVVAIPFVLFLLFKFKFLFAFGLIVSALILALLPTKSFLNGTIPTPFKKIPFESIIGFRKTFWVIPISYILTVQAIGVGNFNLGLFSLALTFLTVMVYYAKPEKIKFVWIYNDRVNHFLWRKMGHGMIAASLYSLPILISLGFVFPDKLIFIGAVQLIGYLLITCMVLTKYSAYPFEINLPQGIFLALCLWFPPMLLIVIPIFYHQSKKRLKTWLE